MKCRQGFTLIEMMIVIVVVGILASVVTIKIKYALYKTQIQYRKAILVNLNQALEQYYTDNNKYPIVTSWYSSEPGDLVPNGPGNNGVWIPGLVPKYISKLPRDPVGGTSDIGTTNCIGW